jgi:hypothetical protein
MLSLQPRRHLLRIGAPHRTAAADAAAAAAATADARRCHARILHLLQPSGNHPTRLDWQSPLQIQTPQTPTQTQNPTPTLIPTLITTPTPTPNPTQTPTQTQTHRKKPTHIQEHIHKVSPGLFSLIGGNKCRVRAEDLRPADHVRRDHGSNVVHTILLPRQRMVSWYKQYMYSMNNSLARSLARARARALSLSLYV